MRLSSLFLLPVLATGAWTESTIQDQDLSRTYFSYTPELGESASYAGIMVFIHGANMNEDVRDEGQFEVAANAERFGFVGVVLRGTPQDEGYGFNVDEPSGVDSVAFVHAVVAEVEAAHSVPDGTPRIAMGFSNGAGLATLMGCFNSMCLWSGTVAVHIQDDADFPSNCTASASSAAPQPTWSAVGRLDGFVSGLGPTPGEGYQTQFEAMASASGCAQEDPTVTRGSCYECWTYASCPGVGKICLYNNTGHQIQPSMTPNAWGYLAGADAASPSTVDGTATTDTCEPIDWSGSGKGGKGGDYSGSGKGGDYSGSGKGGSGCGGKDGGGKRRRHLGSATTSGDAQQCAGVAASPSPEGTACDDSSSGMATVVAPAAAVAAVAVFVGAALRPLV